MKTKPKPKQSYNKPTDIRSFLARIKEERQQQIEARKAIHVQKSEITDRTISPSLNTSNLPVSTKPESEPTGGNNGSNHTKSEGYYAAQGAYMMSGLH